MRAGVVQILALEIDFGAAQLAGQVLREIQRRRPPHIMLQIKPELFLEFRIVSGLVIQLLQFLEGRHQSFDDEFAAELSEMALSIRQCGCTHNTLLLTPAHRF